MITHHLKLLVGILVNLDVWHAQLLVSQQLVIDHGGHARRDVRLGTDYGRGLVLAYQGGLLLVIALTHYNREVLVEVKLGDVGLCFSLIFNPPIAQLELQSIDLGLQLTHGILEASCWMWLWLLGLVGIVIDRAHTTCSLHNVLSHGLYLEVLLVEVELVDGL